MTILYIIAALIALPLIIALFLKKEYHVQRETVINKNKSEVYQFLKYVKNQVAFSPWNELDPNMERTFTGTDGERGFTLRWESDNKKIGVGEQEIESLIPENRINYKFRFYKPFKALNDHGYFQLSEIGENKTKVVWGYDGKLDYPGNIVSLFLNFDKMIGESFEKGLAKMKTVI